MDCLFSLDEVLEADDNLSPLEQTINNLHSIFTSNSLNKEIVQKELKQLGQQALAFLASGRAEGEINHQWRQLQTLFYHHQENYHLYWPQEEEISTEASLLAGVEFVNTAAAEKQPELFKC